MTPSEFTRLVLIAVKGLSPGEYPPVVVEPFYTDMPRHITGAPTVAMTVQNGPGFIVFYDPGWAKKGFSGGERTAIHEACHVVFDDWRTPYREKSSKQRMAEENAALSCQKRHRFKFKKGEKRSKSPFWLPLLLGVLI